MLRRRGGTEFQSAPPRSAWRSRCDFEPYGPTVQPRATEIGWLELDAPIVDRIRTTSGRLRFWQKGGGFDRNVRNLGEFRREVRYIHRNPVKRGLVERPEDWKWSSVRWWMDRREGELECDRPPGDPRIWELWKGYA